MPTKYLPPAPKEAPGPSWNLADEEGRVVSSEEVVCGVAAVLEHFISESDSSMAACKPTAFDGPSMMVDDKVTTLLNHLLTQGLCTKECFVMAVVYLERILQRYPNFRISRLNAHRFVVVSVVVGSKILDDFYCRNVYYAMAAGLTKTELNQLELSLCDLLDFDLHVQPDEFRLYRDSLIRRDARKCADAVARTASSLSISSASSISSGVSSVSSSASSSPMTGFGMQPYGHLQDAFEPLSPHPAVPKPISMGVADRPPPPPLSAWGQRRNWSAVQATKGAPVQAAAVQAAIKPAIEHELQLAVPNIAIVMQQQQQLHHELQQQQLQGEQGWAAVQPAFTSLPTHALPTLRKKQPRVVDEQQYQEAVSMSLGSLGVESSAPQAWMMQTPASFDAPWSNGTVANGGNATFFMQQQQQVYQQQHLYHHHHHHHYQQQHYQPQQPYPQFGGLQQQPLLGGSGWATDTSTPASFHRTTVPSAAEQVGYYPAPIGPRQLQQPHMQQLGGSHDSLDDGRSRLWSGFGPTTTRMTEYGLGMTNAPPGTMLPNIPFQPTYGALDTMVAHTRLPVATTLWGAPQVV